jgi:alpha-L-rhamnosidase
MHALKLKVKILGLWISSTLALSFLLTLLCGCSQDVAIINMRCEYMETPIMIDISNPRFEWQYSPRANFFQKSFKVEVSTDENLLRIGKPDVWNSGEIESPFPIVYMRDNVPLMSLTRFYWRVTARDSSGKKIVSPISYFQTAKMENDPWRAEWITDSLPADYPSPPVFRREFDISKRHYIALLCISGLGTYQAFVNGYQVTYDFYNPEVTDYSKRSMYNTFDVTDYIVKGKNVIYVQTSNGVWKERPTILCDILMYYDDGSREFIVTDDKWKTSLGKYLRNDIRGSMVYDENPSKDAPKYAGYDDSGWKSVVNNDRLSMIVQSQRTQPMTLYGNYNSIPSDSVSNIGGSYFYSKDIYGLYTMNLLSKDNNRIILKLGDEIDKEGHVIPIASDTIYVTGNDSMQTITPFMRFHSFNCVDVECEKPVEKFSLNAYDVRREIKSIGTTRCENIELNKKCKEAEHEYLNTMYIYTMPSYLRQLGAKRNSLYYAMMTCGFGMLNYDGILVYEKLIQDIIDSQGPDGSIQTVVPGPSDVDSKADAVYGSALMMIPYIIYMYTNDSKAIEMSYKAQKRFLGYLKSQEGNDGLLGKGFFEDCFYYYCNKLIRVNGEYIGKNVSEYHRKDSLLAQAINAKWFNASDHTYNSRSLYSTAAAYCFGIVPKEYNAAVADRIKVLSFAPTSPTDNALRPEESELGRRYLLQALTNMGDLNNALGLLQGDKCPSVYDVYNWVSGALAGIQLDPQSPGYSHFLIKPFLAPNVKFAGGWHSAPNGDIRSSWKRKEDGSIYIIVDIPANSSATVITDHTAEYGPGLYKMTFKPIN